ncbi:hypothetical protein Pmar_PMAR011629 [Perkinsus marinus ATCC 50983]|uniref:Uncharacterized protein n=1 Tax=Perkinsus marinus (strain ATCC 50983 / TXsc) TaxID=423536 RepID=C5LCB5_PERM5|nr:hypothetical protein Pmar_PMAR011629 [Perkinsus marinus ATCC 50983]EER05598.1 hypothetical protein Pmar_PMAR011629 [Perkinsus marinus ATCC 50983]|eukprot:XP_002773782.1 hypothetical protein Pmar_PMAR011629 [Perkinsus marinus ATCC 50983]
MVQNWCRIQNELAELQMSKFDPDESRAGTVDEDRAISRSLVILRSIPDRKEASALAELGSLEKLSVELSTCSHCALIGARRLVKACEPIMKAKGMPNTVKTAIDKAVPNILGRDGFMAFFDPCEWEEDGEWQSSRIDMILAAIKAYNDDLGDFDDHRIEKPKIVHDFSTRLGIFSKYKPEDVSHYRPDHFWFIFKKTCRLASFLYERCLLPCAAMENDLQLFQSLSSSNG